MLAMLSFFCDLGSIGNRGVENLCCSPQRSRGFMVFPAERSSDARIPAKENRPIPAKAELPWFGGCVEAVLT